MLLFKENVPLASYTNYKIGGPAKYFCEPSTTGELIEAIDQAKKINEPIFILGGGFNLLISDKGFNGVVIKPSVKKLEADSENIVTVGAGVLVSEFLDFCLEHSLSGWEWAGGLPSTIGGAIWGNAGAFGGETKDSVLEVKSYKAESGELKTRSGGQCEFNYRSSIFKSAEKNEIILEARLQLVPGNREELEKAITEKRQYRENKQPLEYPNCGSVFKNVAVEKIPKETLEQFKGKVKQDPFPVLPTAVLTAAAGLREYRVGGAMVSPKHSNFIVNIGNATAADVLAVMSKIKEVIKEKYGVELEQEVIFVGEAL